MVAKLKYNFLLDITDANYYNLIQVCLSHGWINLSPFNFDKEKSMMSFSFSRYNRKPIALTVIQDKNYLLINSSAELDNQSLLQIKRVLSIDVNIQDLIKTASLLSKNSYNLLKMGHGRLLKSPSLWEDLVKTLLTTNCNWKKTQSMVNSLCTNYGEKVFDNYCFPLPEKISTLSENDLIKIGLGYRAKYLLKLSQEFLLNKIDQLESNNISKNEKINILNNILGFGSYSVNHSLILLNEFSILPIDSDVKQYLLSIGYNENNYNSAYVSWQKYRYWGYKLGRISRNLNWIGD